MTFTVSRSGSLHGTSSVHYETDSGTATSGVDFAPASGMLSFPTGVVSRTLTVDVTGDRLDEPDEVFYVNLSNPTGGHIIDGQGEGTITDDDSSPVAASQSKSTNEDTAAAVTLVATDARRRPAHVLDRRSADARRAHGLGRESHYTPAPNYNGPDSFTFRASDGVNESNVATVSITVDPVNDPPVASDNSAILAEDSFAMVGLPATDVEGDPLTYTIVSAPEPRQPLGLGQQPHLHAGARTTTARTASPSRRTTAAPTRTRPRSPSPSCRSTTPRSRSTTRRRVAEDGSAEIDVLANDTDVDGDPLTVTSVGTPAHGTAVIEGDGRPLHARAELQRRRQLHVHDLRRERRRGLGLGCADRHAGQRPAGRGGQLGAGGSGHARGHPAPRDRPRRRSAHVRRSSTSRSTGRCPARARSGRTRPTCGTTARTRSRSRRTTAPTTSNVATVSITVTGRDPATVGVNDASSQEGNSGELDAVFTVSISEPQPDPVVIDAMSADGTAHEPGDYGAMTTRLTFAAGQTSKTVVVKVHGDTVDEADENFLVNLTVVSGFVVLGDGQGEGTILDDDPLSSLTVGNATVTEGNSGITTADVHGHAVRGHRADRHGRLRDRRRHGARALGLRAGERHAHVRSRPDDEDHLRRRQRRHRDRAERNLPCRALEPHERHARARHRSGHGPERRQFRTAAATPSATAPSGATSPRRRHRRRLLHRHRRRPVRP